MTIQIKTFILGPLQNNTYLLTDDQTRESVIIDPAMSSAELLGEIRQSNLILKQIWITHAHFDHISGAERLSSAFNPSAPIAMHPSDNTLWLSGGGSNELGFELNPGPLPAIPLEHGQVLKIGETMIEIRHTPGHTPGHVIFYSEEAEAAFCGDLIFWHGIGRSDLKGGNFEQLMASIKNQIFTLPPKTRLLCGHGPETTVREEMINNPFIN